VLIQVPTRGQFGGDVWLGFERFTCVPIQTRMVKMELLNKDERKWLKVRLSRLVYRIDINKKRVHRNTIVNAETCSPHTSKKTVVR
jgi:hypothetical protein